MNRGKFGGVKRRLCGDDAVLNKSKRQHCQLADNVSAGDTLKYNKGQEVYVYTAEEAWKEAVVVETDTTEKAVTVTMNDTHQVVRHSVDQVSLCCNKPVDELNNLTHLTPVHEATILTCLRKRFLQGIYYTNAGTTVVAVNPHADVSHLYTVDQIRAYHNREEALPPHIYPVAEKAYSNLVRDLSKGNQSVIISGESGAGKTVSTKHLLRYLTIVTNLTTEPQSLIAAEDKGVQIEQRVVDSNPILEAFGNAATPRNSNSSRFGKFIELQFLRMGRLQGGAIQTYLLEKTRVMHQGQGENNFHVFYQMTRPEELHDYPGWMKDIQNEVKDMTFTCVPLNQDCSENGDLRKTLAAMTNIGLDTDGQRQVFQVLLAILYLGNICFVQLHDDNSDIEESNSSSSYESEDSDDSFMELSVSEWALERSCQMLGVNCTDLRRTLLHRSLQAGGRSRQSVFVKPVGIAEARSRRDCLAMLLYSRLFEWLVAFINNQIKSKNYKNTIGLLDIYGFEIFAANSLEQLCINYANERLQQHYVANFLHSLQEEYTEEGLEWVPVNCTDNRPCVDILDGKSGVFSLLNEEVYLNRKSDEEALKDRMLQLGRAAHTFLRPARRSTGDPPGFVIQHYAGDVQYSLRDLVTKNKDDIPSDLVSLLAESRNTFITQLLASYAEVSSPIGKKKKTVLTKFKSSLDNLISSLVHSSDVHYIRCLRPNNTNTPAVFQSPYVLQQLRACGTIETVNICRQSFPARMTYPEFQERYSLIVRGDRNGVYPGLDMKGGSPQKENVCDPADLLLQQHLDFPLSPRLAHAPQRKNRRKAGVTQQDQDRKVCAMVLQSVQTGQGLDIQHQFGLTKLFLTQQQFERLECARLRVLNHSAVLLQSAWRGYCCRRHFQRLMAAKKICRAWLTFRTRRQFVCLRTATVLLQRVIRQWLHRLHVSRKLSSVSAPDQSSPWANTQSLLQPFQIWEGVGPAQDEDLSDDSGVHELVQCLPRSTVYGPVDRAGDRLLEPHQKRQRLLACSAQLPVVQGVHVGDGIVTRYRVHKTAVRFHTRPSVLQYGHVINRWEFPGGLLDALLPSGPCNYGGQGEGSCVDP